MKKTYTTLKVCIVLLSILSIRLSAQLSGIVTINNTLPVTLTNFTSFATFAAVVNTAGVNGPLTVNVGAGSGPYTEQVSFTVIPGMSSTNTITVNGNGCTISFNSTVAASPHTYMLSGTDFMTVNNLNIVGTSTTLALPLHLWNGSNDNAFNTCTVSCGTNTTTSTNWVPISISGTSVSAVSTGVAGNNNNTFTGCTVNGGYYGICFNSNTSAPFMTGNKVIGCSILNSYYVGIFAAYVTDHLFKNNTLERPALTTLSTSYPIFLNTGVQKTIVEGNLIRNQFVTSFVNTSTFAGVLIQAAPAVGSENIIRNNIISNIRSNGQISGIYVGGYANNIIVHNTISFDDALATAGAVYGIYYSTGPGIIRNNLISITRGGTGAKYCLYYGTATGVVSQNNVLYINAPAGTNYVGYWTAAVASLANWKTTNGGIYDQYSINADPQYAVPGSNYTPTNQLVNNIGTAAGVLTDIGAVTRNLASPDPGAIEIFNAACFGTPGTATITAPTGTYCAGTVVNLSMGATVYTNSGISYQWQTSTSSALGPFTPVTGATLTTLTTSPLVSLSTYYSVLVTCAGGGSLYVPSGLVNMVLTATNTVPYYESFETLNTQNNLPNCSWAVSNTVAAVTQTMSNPNGRIPKTGINFGMFSNTTPGTNYFYTNKIWMDPGFTYSASLWFLTESVGYTNWTDMSILIGQNQTPTGLVAVASTSGIAMSATHKLLSGTFSVAASGFYYVAVRTTAVAGSAVYLSWDDLRIDAPCSVNSPSISLLVPTNTICSNNPITISATGADTYTWSTGDNTPVVTVTPAIAATSYTVTGTRALTGCSSSAIQYLTVYPSPVVFATSNLDIVCSGSPVNLSGVGNGVVGFSWGHGVNTAGSIVYPTTSTTYSVMGINSFGCISMDTKLITVNQLPGIIVNSSASQICQGEPVTLTGNGGLTYNWTSNTSIVYNGNPLTLNPQASTMFTLSGIDANGCSNKTYYTLLVEECTGLNKITGTAGNVKVYPNPGISLVTVDVNKKGEKTIEVIDLTGRVVLLNSNSDEKTEIDMSGLNNGVYYLRVKMENTVEVIKVVKIN